MSNQSGAESGLVPGSDAVASFSYQHTLLSRVQHALHSNPALVPLILEDNHWMTALSEDEEGAHHFHGPSERCARLVTSRPA